MGSTPSSSCKNRFILEKSDQFKFSETITGSQGFCFFITLFKYETFLSVIFKIAFNLTNKLSRSLAFSGTRCN